MCPFNLNTPPPPPQCLDLRSLYPLLHPPVQLYVATRSQRGRVVTGTHASGDG